MSMYEVYGRGAIGHEAAKNSRGLNINGIGVLDLRFNNPEGVPWDLTKPDHQKMAFAMIDKDDPDWIVGAPPCTDWGILNWNCNFSKMDPQDVKRRLKTALVHLTFVCKLYQEAH